MSQSEALKKAQEKLAAMRVQGIQFEKLTPQQKAEKNPKSLRFAVNAKCWDCACGQISEIRECNIKTCGLWNVRPYQRGEAE